jgi:formamidopyrimidine-DNA glycosylase
MPELPEVETVRRGLEPVLAGRQLARVEQRRPDLRFPFPERFAERLSGRVVTALGRRSKYMLWHLDSGETVIVHLGMSGRMTIAREDRGALPLARPARDLSLDPKLVGTFTHDTGGHAAHDHVVLHVEGGATVTYNDPRRFGFMLLAETAALDSHPLIAGLGPEPTGNELSADYLAQRAADRKADLKAFLMDQRTIAGLGNIYVCEALYRAGLSPQRAAACLARRDGVPTERCERLVASIRAVIAEAIAAGGSSLRDYKQADGSLGYFQNAHLVYGREGQPCANPGCRGMVRRTIQAGRSTFHCGRCQR